MRNRLADHPAKFNVSQSECSLANLEKILCQFDMAVEVRKKTWLLGSLSSV